MTRNVRILRPVLAVLGATLALTACSSTRPDQLSSGAGYSVLGALREIPTSAVEQEDLPVTIATGDIAGALAASGMGEASDEVERRQQQNRLMGIQLEGDLGVPVYVPIPRLLSSYVLEDLGLESTAVNSFVEVSQGREEVVVFQGDWDDDALESTLPEVAGPVYAQTEDRIMRTAQSSVVTEWIGGEFESLAADGDLAAVATALDDAGVVASFIYQSDVTGPPAANPDVAPAGRISWMAIGWSVVDGASEISLVYHFDSPESAEDAVPIYQEQYDGQVLLHSGEPLSDRLELIEAGTVGSVVVVTARPTQTGRPGDVLTMLMSMDVPFQYRW